MIFSNLWVWILGTILAVVEGVQQALHLGGYWHAALSAIVIMVGLMGVHAATPAQIVAKIPAHVAVVIGAVASALEVLQQANISMPTGVHVAIGVIVVVVVTLGINVTGIAVSKSALAKTTIPPITPAPPAPPIAPKV